MAEDNDIPNLEPNDRIIPINIEEEMKAAYIDYSMSVIVSRALPALPFLRLAKLAKYVGFLKLWKSFRAFSDSF